MPSNSNSTTSLSSKDTIHLMGLANLIDFPPHFIDLGKLIFLIISGIFDFIIFSIDFPFLDTSAYIYSSPLKSSEYIDDISTP